MASRHGDLRARGSGRLRATGGRPTSAGLARRARRAHPRRARNTRRAHPRDARGSRRARPRRSRGSGRGGTGTGRPPRDRSAPRSPRTAGASPPGRGVLDARPDGLVAGAVSGREAAVEALVVAGTAIRREDWRTRRPRRPSGRIVIAPATRAIASAGHHRSDRSHHTPPQVLSCSTHALLLVSLTTAHASRIRTTGASPVIPLAGPPIIGDGAPSGHRQAAPADPASGSRTVNRRHVPHHRKTPVCGGPTRYIEYSTVFSDLTLSRQRICLICSIRQAFFLASFISRSMPTARPSQTATRRSKWSPALSLHGS